MNTKQSGICPSCGKLIKEDFNNCPYCGKPIRKICQQCGKLLDDEFNNCPYCGAKVKSRPSLINSNLDTKDINRKFGIFLTSIGNFFQKAGQIVKSFILASISFLITIFQKFLGWLKSIDWGKFGQFLKTSTGKLLDSLKSINWGKFGQNLKSFGSKLVNWLKSIKWGNIGKYIGSFVNKILNAIKTALPQVVKFFSNIWSFIKNNFSRLWDSLSHLMEKKLAPAQARKFALAIILTVSSVCFLSLIFLVFGTPGSPAQNQSVTDDQNIATSPTVDPSQQKWLVMIYADADDEVLENDIYFDLNEAEAAGSTDRVQIVAQLDRYSGGYNGDGDWTSARRYFVTHDDDLNAVHSEMVADLGEVDMGSTSTLIDFITWAIQTYPADRYALILSDHGSGWIGGWYDNDPMNPTGNFIPLNQMDTAFGNIIETTNIGKFDLIGMDACLMGMLEVYNALEPYANYAVASEEVEPSMGWAYEYFLNDLASHPEMDGAGLSRSIVNGYIQQDMRIQDEAAYKELLASYELPTNVEKELFAQKMTDRVTLSAIDLSVLPEFNEELNQLLIALKESDQGMVAEARSYAQAFHNIFEDNLPSPYIDLKNFLNIISENVPDKSIQDHIVNLESIFNTMIISEVNGSNYPGAFGISIYFPVSQQFWGGETNTSHDWYVETVERFAMNSLWDDFLAYHYAGLDFGQGIPSIESRTAAPGFSEITISTPMITPDAVSLANPRINIQADISGDRIAYIYLVSMYQYQNKFLFYESDFILGDENIDVNGVIYPKYKQENGITHIDLDYEIYATGITDGKTAAFAVLEPETYGTAPEETIYSVKGFYIDAQTGRRTSARMYFYNYGDNEMRNIIGYFGDSEHGIAPAEIIPEKGDQFLFLDTWWEIDENGNLSDYLAEGNSLTFGDQPFMMGVTPNFVYPGSYAIGIGVEDMDGNQTFSFSPIVLE